MKKILFAGLILVLSISYSLEAQVKYQNVEVNGSQIQVRVDGLEERKFLQPVVIFEAGLAEELNVWDKVFDQVSEFSPVLSYSRSGIGWSEPIAEEVSLESRAKQLHLLLQELDIEPPYIFVGNNWGNEVIREFAAKYPNQIKGMVYLDPIMDLDNVEDLTAYLEEQGLDGELLTQEYLEFQKSIKSRYSEANKQEVAAFLGLLEKNKLNWEAKEIPFKNSIILLGRGNDMYPMMDKLSMNSRKFYQLMIDGKVDFFEKYTLENNKSSLVLTSAGMNFLPLQRSLEITMAIQQLINTDVNLSIVSASMNLNVKEFDEFINGLETYVMPSLLDERTYNMLGYSLMRRDQYENALVLLKKNLEKHPESANVYDSYGEGLVAVGKVEEAIPMFEKAIKLGSHGPHRDLGLFKKNLEKSKNLLVGKK
ncbi:alpha/beta fold hydrolase [Algoriphagus machipongonensis]|uniref:Alpha/beta hydrolase n=1 Tax=Algoriphagus machipongonensis TaxID=388413 RepID=A3HZ21_9BACT|nr:alpha/beta hydrolase [Algoriphagus machipongonensis]EAZ80507.1 alpha/beta hydrolase [Algoriphagus machipongonensis]